jgi:SP family sugar:H+ symporter-like MFS transporter
MYQSDPIYSIICDVVNTVMTLFGVQLIDRIGRRRLLMIGALGMCICEFIIAIVSRLDILLLRRLVMIFFKVGVTAGDIQPGGAVNLAAQRVLIAFICM